MQDREKELRHTKEGVGLRSRFCHGWEDDVEGSIFHEKRSGEYILPLEGKL